MKKISIKNVQKFLKEKGYVWKKEFKPDSLSTDTGFIKAKHFCQLANSSLFAPAFKVYQNKQAQIKHFEISPRVFREVEQIVAPDGKKSKDYIVKEDHSKDWMKYLRKKGFDIDYDINDLSREDWIAFVDTLRNSLPRDVRPHNPQVRITKYDGLQCAYLYYPIDITGSEMSLIVTSDLERSCCLNISGHIYQSKTLEENWHKFLQAKIDEKTNQLI